MSSTEPRGKLKGNALGGLSAVERRLEGIAGVCRGGVVRAVPRAEGKPKPPGTLPAFRGAFDPLAPYPGRAPAAPARNPPVVTAGRGVRAGNPGRIGTDVRFSPPGAVGCCVPFGD